MKKTWDSRILSTIIHVFNEINRIVRPLSRHQLIRFLEIVTIFRIHSSQGFLFFSKLFFLYPTNDYNVARLGKKYLIHEGQCMIVDFSTYLIVQNFVKVFEVSENFCLTWFLKVKNCQWIIFRITKGQVPLSITQLRFADNWMF